MRMDKLKLILPILRYALATILLLAIFYIVFLYINRLEIKPDQRYSSISLLITIHYLPKVSHEERASHFTHENANMNQSEESLCKRS